MGIKDGKPCKVCGNFDYNASGGCRVCKRNRRNIWRKNNPERDRQEKQEWHEKHKKRRNEESRLWAKNNKEKHSRRNVLWAKQNPEKRKSINATRRARKTNAGGSFTTKEWVLLCKKYNNKCLACGVKLSSKTLQADHILPIALGGSSNIENIQPLCQRCNASKGARYIDYR